MHGQPISVDNTGHLINNANPSGVLGTLVTVCSTVALICLPLLWLSFVGRQVVSWRRSTGERRQQLKWLMSGGALSIVGLVGLFLSGQYSGRIATSLNLLGFGILALPISIGVGILKYRLYEIDRLISRTLVVRHRHRSRHRGVRRHHHLDDQGPRLPLAHRRRRIDPGGRCPVQPAPTSGSSASSIVASTAPATTPRRPLRPSRHGLRDAVDLETVRAELLEVVNRAVEPAHASVWIRRRGA